jgi:RNA polymerase sigma-70 factor (ECF subfamily)
VSDDLERGEVRRLGERDPAALARCFHVHGARVWRLARGMLGQAADADDATQEIFLRVQEKAASFDGRGSFAAWVRRLAVNHCLNRLAERRRREARCETDHVDAIPATAKPGIETSEALERALARLPDDQRAALVLREIDGRSYREIADLLAIPIGTVMSRLARARERLLGIDGGGSNGARAGRTGARTVEVGRDE